MTEIRNGMAVPPNAVSIRDRVPAIKIPLMWAIHHAGDWRLVVGVEVNVDRRIVSVRLLHWGGVVDFPAHDIVEITGPVLLGTS